MRKADYLLAASALGFLKGGRVEVHTDHTKSLVLKLDKDTIDLDFHNPALFSAENRVGLMDALKGMKKLGRALADREITLSISRKGSTTIRLGKKAKPSFSRLATGSGDIQIVNLKELRKLDKEL